MSTLFIHIGPSKTASSFLQSVLPSLQSEDRFRPLGFPTSPTGKANWSLLASLFDPDNTLISNKESSLMDIDKPLEFLLQKLQKGDQLISGEHLGDMESIGFHNLKEIIKPHKLRVLLFARTYELRSLSLWQESIKWGETNSFHDFLTSKVCSVESVKKIGINYVYESAVNGLEQESAVSISTLPCHKFSLEEAICTLSRWTERSLSLKAEPRTESNERHSLKNLCQFAVLNHVLNSVFSDFPNEVRNSLITSTFANQFPGGPLSVERYFKMNIRESIELLQELKSQELDSLKVIRPNCLEGTDQLLFEMSQNRMSAIEEFFAE